jgi:hypothetical protein
MAKSRRNTRKSRKASRKSRKASRKSRRQSGGELSGAPLDYSLKGPSGLNLAQGQQFAAYHSGQHGGAMAYGPYPGAVQEASMLPADLVASAHLLPLNQAFDYIRQFGPDADLKGGRRRRRSTRKGSRKGRKGRKATRKGRKGRKGSKQHGGVLVRWGGGARRMRGGSLAEMRYPMPVGEESKMLIPAALQAQAGLNPEWKLAENPSSFDPIATKF